MIDSHCHIDLYRDPLAIAREAEMHKIHTVAVTHLPSHYQQAKAHLHAFSYVCPALGLHPLVSHKHKGELQMFRKLCENAKFIGEIGLDFSSAGRSTRLEQEHSFDFVLGCISANRRFVTLHSRGAESEVLASLRNHSVNQVVFHFFSGSRAHLVRLLDEGHFVSINTAMTQTAKWQKLIQTIPLTRVLTETDGPFVKHSGHPAKPNDVVQVYKWLSSKFSTTLEKVIAQIDYNFHSLTLK